MRDETMGRGARGARDGSRAPEGDSGRLGVVVPCHNEEESLPYFFGRMGEVEAELPLSVFYVLVDDGSADGTLEVIKGLSASRPEVHYVSFSRNFGKEAAIAAGMRKAVDMGADLVTIMDADLQDPPELLPQMYRDVTEGGYDVSAAYRTTREGESRVRSWFARKFYGLINRISDVQMKDGARDFRLMHRSVARAVVDLPELERFSKGIFSWVGFKTAWVPYENVEREHGSTSWSFTALVRYALEGIIAFSTAPLEAISIAGLVVFLLAVVFLVFVVVRALLFGDPVAGWPSIVAVVTLLGGANLLGVGVAGLYISKVYTEVKRRPLYLIDEEG